MFTISVGGGGGGLKEDVIETHPRPDSCVRGAEMNRTQTERERENGPTTAELPGL